MTKKVHVKKILQRIEIIKKLAEGRFIKAINSFEFGRILEIELKTFNPDKYDALMAKANYMISSKKDIDQLDYLKSILPLSKIDRANDTPGRIKEYTALSHHIWVTDMNKVPRDIAIYGSGKFIGDKYIPTRKTVDIDDENSFVESILNLRNGAKQSNLPLSEDNFYNILWTNYSREDLITHPELTNLRKICNIDKSKIDLPDFIVLNINDVMDKDISEIKDQANLARLLPQSLIKGLADTKNDLLSVRIHLDEMKEKKMFASMSDIMRIAFIKDIGGLYFDIDQAIFDQEKVHIEQEKYNLFDLMKNYECILSKEGGILLTTANGFISVPQPKSSVMNEAWKMIYRNITDPETVEYVKYANNGFSKVICMGGPIAITLALMKAYSDKDFSIAEGRLMHMMKDTDHPYIGLLGHTICSGTWVEDAKNLFHDYLCYDLETGKGITADEWSEMI